jgi:GntR family transcriptional regulator
MSDKQPVIVFRMDPHSDRAPFRQLVDQVSQAIERGQLQPGDRLPSVREVVRQITINPNTVHRAYRELEHLDLVEGRSGLGTFVVASSAVGLRKYRSRSWHDIVRDGIMVARSAGVNDEHFIDGVRELLSAEAEVRP